MESFQRSPESTHFFFLWLCCAVCGILVSQSWIKSRTLNRQSAESQLLDRQGITSTHFCPPHPRPLSQPPSPLIRQQCLVCSLVPLCPQMHSACFYPCFVLQKPDLSVWAAPAPDPCLLASSVEPIRDGAGRRVSSDSPLPSLPAEVWQRLHSTTYGHSSCHVDPLLWLQLSLGDEKSFLPLVLCPIRPKGGDGFPSASPRGVQLSHTSDGAQ